MHCAAATPRIRDPLDPVALLPMPSLATSHSGSAHQQRSDKLHAHKGLIGVAACNDRGAQAHAGLVEHCKLPCRQPLVIAVQRDSQLAAAIAAALELAAVQVGAVPHLLSQG